MANFFITATGTDVGKTFVTAGIIREMRRRGEPVEALKPIMSGYDSATMSDSDAAVLLAALGREVTAETIEAISPWRFLAPLSPDIAAARENKVIDVEAIGSYCRDHMAKNNGTLLIEGVGGVMVPLDQSRTIVDLIKALDIPAVLVTGSYLGTISHTLTALAALRHAGIEVRAIIISESSNSTVALDDTIAAISRFASGIKIFAIPRLDAANTPHPAFAEIAAQLR